MLSCTSRPCRMSWWIGQHSGSSTEAEIGKWNGGGWSNPIGPPRFCRPMSSWSAWATKGKTSPMCSGGGSVPGPPALGAIPQSSISMSPTLRRGWVARATMRRSTQRIAHGPVTIPTKSKMMNPRRAAIRPPWQSLPPMSSGTIPFWAPRVTGRHGSATLLPVMPARATAPSPPRAARAPPRRRAWRPQAPHPAPPQSHCPHRRRHRMPTAAMPQPSQCSQGMAASHIIPMTTGLRRPAGCTSASPSPESRNRKRAD
mmetsp:Transcript_63049/g.182812  ORF Transcript_63049/g.182812 Transcript_63049/m.182812 type:complete len:257 (+) Transcript_63049:813-1583(+)